MNNFDEKGDIRIIIADDHEVVRVGLRRLMSLDKSIIVIDEAQNGEEAVELVRIHKPDIALLDILMPKVNGIEATEMIKQNYPDVFVVILTAFEDSVHIESAMSAGADGYLTKDISAKDLVASLRNVKCGERVFSKNILNLLNKKFVPYHESDSSPVLISRREQEILNLVSSGLTSPEIADKLFISVRTVQSHRSNIMQKLGVKNTAELVRYVYERNEEEKIN
ncbi:MAG: response regulator transcription factor [Ignavibacteriae bacterium]|nr:response regulator transcription factor [Ignavibacteriota bacterium]